MYLWKTKNFQYECANKFQHVQVRGPLNIKWDSLLGTSTILGTPNQNGLPQGLGVKQEDFIPLQ
jgi:hypothetical protein